MASVLLDYALTKGIKTFVNHFCVERICVLLDYALTKGIKTLTHFAFLPSLKVLLDYALTKGIKTAASTITPITDASYWTTP